MKSQLKAYNSPWEAYVFLAPWIIGLLSFTIVPMFMSFYFSFTRYDMVNPPRWIGFDNFIEITRDTRVHKSFQVTFTYVFMGVPFQLLFALVLAAILKKNRFGIRLYRAIYYLPSLFGGSVAVALLWRQIFNKEGVINRLLAIAGIEGQNWIAQPSTALSTLIFLNIWQFGASMVIFLGGLKQISTDYYEAAEIDGAGKARCFFSITLPLLTPMVFFNIVMSIIGAFQAFTSSYIISGGSGSPLDSTLFYTLYLYIKAFRQFSMGYASALAWLLLVIIAVITRLMFIAADKWVYYDD
ncbi:MAG: sugar ABC transporter permease [Treponema sp.]|nr:sugar ABC transporter permease [Treponema sp.]